MVLRWAPDSAAPLMEGIEMTRKPPNPTLDPTALRRECELHADYRSMPMAPAVVHALLDAVEERDALRVIAELEGEVLAATHAAEDFGEAWREAQSERDALRDALRIERDNLAGTIGWIRKRVDAKDGEATEHAVEQLYRERDAARAEAQAWRNGMFDQAQAVRDLQTENAALRARVTAAGAIVEYARGTQWCTTDGDCIRKEYAARCAPCRRKHDYRVALATWDATAPARGQTPT